MDWWGVERFWLKSSPSSLAPSTPERRWSRTYYRREAEEDVDVDAVAKSVQQEAMNAEKKVIVKKIPVWQGREAKV